MYAIIIHDSYNYANESAEAVVGPYPEIGFVNAAINVICKRFNRGRDGKKQFTVTTGCADLPCVSLIDPDDDEIELSCNLWAEAVELQMIDEAMGV